MRKLRPENEVMLLTGLFLIAGLFSDSGSATVVGGFTSSHGRRGSAAAGSRWCYCREEVAGQSVLR